MRIRVRDYYSNDNLSQINDTGWGVVLDIVEYYGDEGKRPLELDFEDIEVKEPWSNDIFKRAMRHLNVTLILHDSAATVENINVACMLGRMGPNRARNIVHEEDVPAVKKVVEKPKFPEDELRKNFVIDDYGKHILMVKDRYTQVSNIRSLEFIEEAIKYRCDWFNLKNVTIDFGDIFMQKNFIGYFSEMVARMYKNGIIIDVEAEDEEFRGRMELHQFIREHKADPMERTKIIMAKLKPGRVGMLVRYMPSKAVDEFGRQGEGNVAYCRVAIYRGRDREGLLIFDEYKAKNFITDEHWMLENDGESMKRLPFSRICTNCLELGLENEFLGSKYLFIKPIQRIEDDMQEILSIGPNGRLVRSMVTIPERIKTVLDSWGVEYDEDGLDASIRETKLYLRKIRKEVNP